MGLLRDFQHDPALRLRQLKDRLRSSLWLAPALAVGGAIGVAIALMGIDRRIAEDRVGWYLFDGGPDSAQELLSTITASMLTFTALVFSITVLALQLASNQFSPRVIRTFLSERATKLALSVFVGTFVYAMVVLSQVRIAEPEFVPEIATWFALVMVLASVGIFIRYIHRMTHSIRAITVITKIAAETREGIDRMYPESLVEPPDEAPLPAEPPDRLIAHAGAPSVVAFIDDEELGELAERADAVIEIVPRVGEFLPTGAPLFRIWGELDDDERCHAAVVMEIERTPEQDPAFGMRQLVDIACRALSPGINDPTTATQALDHVHDLMRRLTRRYFPARTRVDASGALRLIAARPTYADYVQLAFEEIRMYGASSIQVNRRLELALRDCAELADPVRRKLLERERARVQTQLHRLTGRVPEPPEPTRARA